MLAHVSVVIRARQPLDQEPQDDVSRIRVSIAGSRLERRWLVHKQCEIVFESAHIVSRTANRRGEDVASDAGGVPQQLANRDLARDFLVWIIRPVRGERRIDIELSRGLKLENRNL